MSFGGAPFAIHLLAQAARRAGVAAAEGVADKKRRYKPSDGVCIEAWSCELLGAPTPELLRSLQSLSVLAAEVQAERGFRASDWVDAWTCELSAMVFRLSGVALYRAYSAVLGGDRPLC